MIAEYLFRTPPGKSPDGKVEVALEDKIKEKPSDNQEYILCRACFRVITRETERISVNGAHKHIFSNPHGIVFEIGCFGTAEGCGCVGPATDEFSWFKGSSWRMAVCGSCLAHLGWLFTTYGLESFYGLILNRLVVSM